MFRICIYFQVLPPVRNSLDKKKKKRVKKAGDGTAGKTKRISSYDYRAWDKFDVVSRSIHLVLCFERMLNILKVHKVQKSSHLICT